ncbi:MAG: hypothetical protein ACREDW_04795, partial [Aestuariivirgaceae bacterium]
MTRQHFEPQKGAGGLEFSEAPVPPGLEATMKSLPGNGEDAGPELGKFVMRRLFANIRKTADFARASTV